MIVIINNFGPGYGPFVRTLELSKAVYWQLTQKLAERINIIMPLVYGRQQIRIIEEEVNKDEFFRDKILFSEEIGNVIKPLLFSGKNISAELRSYSSQLEEVSESIKKILKKKVNVKKLDGTALEIDPQQIKIEVSRNPVVCFGIKNSYYSSIGYMSGILQTSLNHLNDIKINPEILLKNIKLAKSVEGQFKLRFIPCLNSLSFDKQQENVNRNNEVKTPPLISEVKRRKSFQSDSNNIRTYVSISGIAGLGEIYEEALDLDHILFANKSSVCKGKVKHLSPLLINETPINYIFSRAAWNTIWLSNILGITLICPKFVHLDHPEIFFNLKTIERLQLGYVWDKNKQSLKNFIKNIDYKKQKVPSIYFRMLKKYGTLNGIEFCAKHITSDFLNDK